MERSESVYRRDHERFDAGTNSGLADVVSRRTERRLEVGTNGHRQTMRGKSRKCFKGYHRTRTARTHSDAAPGRTESGAFMVQSDSTEQAMNTRDAYVTSTCDVALQNTVTCTSHIPEGYPEEAIPHSSDYPFCLSLPRTERPTPEGGRSESHTIKRRFQRFRFGGSMGLRNHYSTTPKRKQLR
jgi:hypothetical protein